MFRTKILLPVLLVAAGVFFVGSAAEAAPIYAPVPVVAAPYMAPMLTPVSYHSHYRGYNRGYRGYYHGYRGHRR